MNLGSKQNLSGTTFKHKKSKVIFHLLKKLAWNRYGIITVPITSALVIGLRWLSLLQPLEWAALDTFFQLRPLEPPDERIVIIGIQESDIQHLKQWPISDKVLAELINKIKQQKPRAIGLDIYRDLAVNPGHAELIKVFRSTPNLIGVQKVIGDEFNARGEVLSSKIAPPPELERLGQISASDTPVDGDGVVRRGILFPMPEGNKAIPSLGLAVAGLYLQKQGISPTSDPNGLMKLNQTVFMPFESNDGGYVRADAGSYQTLLNFRGPSQSFTQVSLTAVLENRIAPDLMSDRIVLIGSVADSINDFFYTPYSGGLISNNRDVIASPSRTPGVEIHANLASQVLNSTLNNRSLIKVWSEPMEGLWVIFWATLPTILSWKLNFIITYKKNVMKLILSMILYVVIAAIILLTISYQAFLISWWIPVVPSFLALCTSAFTITAYTYINNLQKFNTILKLALTKQSQELEDKNRQLEKALNYLEITQKLPITQDKIMFKEAQNELGLDEELLEELDKILFSSVDKET